jgi:hypothetical protein
MASPAARTRSATACASRASSAAASSAMAPAARAASPLSGARTGRGQISNCAQMPATAASAQPSRRSGSAEAGAGIMAARMNVSIAAVPAAAK